jgi:hypothetical protein
MMEKGSDGLRERLLARLPQPENVVAYREETAVLLARHEKALSWEKLSYGTLLICAFVLLFMSGSSWGQRLDPRAALTFYTMMGLMFLAALSTGLRYLMYRTKVDILKEVKQVQLQVVELQASLRKDGAE